MKRTLSMLLVLVMLLGMIPVTSLAAESAPVSPAATTETPSVQAEPAAEETKALGVTFTCGEKTYTQDFDDTHYSYSVVLEGMEDVLLSVNGVTEKDTVVVDGETLAFGESKSFSLTSASTAIQLSINDVWYTVSVSNQPIYQLTGLTILRGDNSEALTLTPAFDPNVHTGYSVMVPDYVTSSAKLCLSVSPEPEPEEMFYYWETNTTLTSWYRYRTEGTISVSRYHQDPYSFSLGYNRDEAKDYVVLFQYFATLKKLAIDGVMKETFDPETFTYHAYVDGTASSVSITPTPYKNTYKITINGQDATAGAAFEVPCEWDEQGKMQVTIALSGMNDAVKTRELVPSTYTIELEKMPVENTPFMMKEVAQEADYTVITKSSQISALEVYASASGELSYQWYYNATATTEGGTAVEGATESSFKPPVTEDAIGTRYYFCKITNTGAQSDNVICSTPTRVTVDPDPTPVVTLVNPGEALPDDGYEYPWDRGYVYQVGQAATPLKVEVSSAAEGGTYTYEWFRRTTADRSWGADMIREGNGTDTYVPKTDLAQANNAGWLYYCDVTYTFKGVEYYGRSSAGRFVTNSHEETYEDDAAFVFVKVDKADTPVFTTQP